MTTLKVLAGPRAFSHIRAHGLNQTDVQSVVCASGAAKTLTTIGLDKVILGQWLKNIDHAVDLLGTSAGAFKLAAASPMLYLFHLRAPLHRQRLPQVWEYQRLVCCKNLSAEEVG